MIEAYHIAALAVLSLYAARQKTRSGVEWVLKLITIATAAWAAVIVAKDWFA